MVPVPPMTLSLQGYGLDPILIPWGCLWSCSSTLEEGGRGTPASRWYVGRGVSIPTSGGDRWVWKALEDLLDRY